MSEASIKSILELIVPRLVLIIMDKQSLSEAVIMLKIFFETRHVCPKILEKTLDMIIFFRYSSASSSIRLTTECSLS